VICSGRHVHRYDVKNHNLHISEITIFILYSKQRFTFLLSPYHSTACHQTGEKINHTRSSQTSNFTDIKITTRNFKFRATVQQHTFKTRTG